MSTNTLSKTPKPVACWMSDVTLIQHATGFGVFDRVFVDVVRGLEDPYPYTRGLIAEFGPECATIPYDQRVRTLRAQFRRWSPLLHLQAHLLERVSRRHRTDGNRPLPLLFGAALLPRHPWRVHSRHPHAPHEQAARSREGTNQLRLRRRSVALKKDLERDDSALVAVILLEDPPDGAAVDEGRNENGLPLST